MLKIFGRLVGSGQVLLVIVSKLLLWYKQTKVLIMYLQF